MPKSPRVYRRLFTIVSAAVASTSLFTGSSAHALNTADVFTTGTDLTLGSDWSLGTVPTSANDAEFTSSSPSGALTLSAATANYGSLDDLHTGVTTTITNTSTGTATTLTLGGSSSTGNSVSANSSDLIFVSGAASTVLNIYGGTGTNNKALNVTLGQSGNFDVGTGSSLNVDNAGTAVSNLSLGTFTLTDNGAGTVNIGVAGSVISGSGGLAITAGITSINGANTFSGGVNLSGAGLIIYGTAANDNAALGTGTLTIGAGSTLDLAAGYGGLNYGNAETWNGNFTLQTGGKTENLSGAITLGQSITLNANSYNSSNLPTVTGIINDNVGGVSQGYGITVTGAGAGSIVAFTGANTYTGATAVQSGILKFSTVANVNSGTATSLGEPTTVANGTISLGATTNNGTLSYTGTGSTTDRVINLAGTTGGGTLDQSGTGNIDFTSNLTATGVGAKTLSLSGSTAGTGEIDGAIVDSSSGATSVSKSGTGTWTLTGANSYTGSTTVTGGVLILNGSNSGNGNTSLSGGILELGTGTNNGLSSGTITPNTGAIASSDNNPRTVSNAFTGFNASFTVGNTQGATTGLGNLTFTSTFADANNSFTVTNSTVATFSNTFGFGSRLQKLGTGTLALTNAANTGTGATAIGNGTVSVAKLANGGSSSSLGTSNNAAGNLSIGSNLTPGTLQYTGTGDSTDRLFTVGNQGAALDASGTGAVNFTNTGAAVIAEPGTLSANFTAGSTTVTVTNTALSVGQVINNAALPAGTTITALTGTGGATSVTVSAAATATASASSTTFGGFNRAITLTGSNTGLNTFATTVADSSAGSLLSINKTGAGTWALTGTNTYSNGTNVTGGTLLANGGGTTGSATGTGAVSVATGTFLGGTGRIGGATTINTGGAITGGTVGTVGMLTLASSVALNGTYQVDIGTGATSDVLAITGTLSGTGIINVNSGTLDGTDTYVIATAGSDTGTFSLTNAAGYSLQTVGSNLELVPAAVPEPSTWLGGLVALGGLGWHQRRRAGAWLCLRRQRTA